MLVSSSSHIKAIASHAPNSKEAPFPKSKPNLSNTKITEAHVLEENILEQLSGLELYKDLHVFDVPIDFQGENYIHTYRCGDENTENLVLIHGYGGCSLLYYPMLKELSKKYKVFCIDLLGMGLSSRPEFKCNSTEETVSFFVESIEKWREAMGIKSFHLGGHSFGGYMGCHYTLKYQERVKKLFLLSPVGVSKVQEQVSVEEWLKGLSWVRRQMFKMILGMWESKTTIGEYYRNHCIIGNFLLKKYLTRQFGNRGKEEKLVEQLHKFFSAIFRLEGGSDKAVYFILKPPRARPILPLEDLIMKGINVPTVVYYGDNDWMDKNGSWRIYQSGEKDFRLKEITESGHQITMHNPIMLAQELNSEILCK